MVTALRALFDVKPPVVTTLTDWWQATEQTRGRFDETIDRALVGGACADRLGFAFASGYSEALRALAGDQIVGITALCATESGGNHPRAIQTSLVEVAPGRYELTGRKKWASLGPAASSLLIVASTGVVDDRNRLRVVRVSTTAPGVRVTPVAQAFLPEIPHAEVELERVAIAAGDVLPGDGYDDYLKPFRTVEDTHIHAAVVGYLIGVVLRHDFAVGLVDRLLACAAAVRAIALADRKAPVTHLALAGAIELVDMLGKEVGVAWQVIGNAEWERWQRDHALLRVAQSARDKRRARAWADAGTGR